MKRIQLKTMIRRRILPILLGEILLAVVFSYAIVLESHAYNRKKVFDATKTNLVLSSIIQPTKATAKETAETIQENADETLVEPGTVNYADKWLGYPYRLGGRNIETGLDCAGFVNYVFTHGPAGKSWTSMSVGGLYNEIGGESISVKNMKPGDIIFFGSNLSHVAIYAGNGEIVHAMDESHGICRTKLFRSDGKTYSGKTIKNVRRVL